MLLFNLYLIPDARYLSSPDVPLPRPKITLQHVQRVPLPPGLTPHFLCVALHFAARAHCQNGRIMYQFLASAQFLMIVVIHRSHRSPCTDHSDPPSLLTRNRHRRHLTLHYENSARSSLPSGASHRLMPTPSLSPPRLPRSLTKLYEPYKTKYRKLVQTVEPRGSSPKAERAKRPVHPLRKTNLQLSRAVPRYSSRSCTGMATQPFARTATCTTHI